MATKYQYFIVIQQNYDAYGWEDVSEYETNSTYIKYLEDGMNHQVFKNDLKEYRTLGYPTRTIKRRVLRE